MIEIEDRLRLSPSGFKDAAQQCFNLLPFKIQKPVKVVVQSNPGKGWPRRKLSLGFGDTWLITLYADDIDANVQRSRLYYWLLTSFQEIARVHFMEQTPRSKADDEKCRNVAEETVLKYRQDWFGQP